MLPFKMNLLKSISGKNASTLTRNNKTTNFCRMKTKFILSTDDRNDWKYYASVQFIVRSKYSELKLIY